MSVEEAARLPVRTALSGPSAGVAGAAWIAASAGFDAIATFDMGGTSTDVAFVRGRRARARVRAGDRRHDRSACRRSTSTPSAPAAGRSPGATPAARSRSGPQSAGADPGPGVLRARRQAPTVTDANLLLGRLGPEGLLGGAVPLDPARAEAAIGAARRRSSACPSLETARGIVRVVNANMANAVRLVTVQRGVDPDRPDAGAVRRRGAAPRGRAGARAGHPRARGAAGPGAALRARPARRGSAHRRRPHAPGAARRLRPCPRSPRASTSMERDALPVARPRARARRRAGASSAGSTCATSGQNFELLVAGARRDVAGWGLRRPPPAVLRDPRAGVRIRRRGRAHAGRQRAARWRGARRSADTRAAPARRRATLPRPRSAAAASTSPTSRASPRARCTTGRGSLAGQRIAGPAVIEQFDATTFLLPGQEASVDDLGLPGRPRQGRRAWTA